MGSAETVQRRRRIVVADDLDEPTALMCLAHELAHLRMHKWSRDSRCHGVVRLEAGSVAYLLLARLGCLPDVPSADLVTRPAVVVGRTPPVRLIETLGGRVVATADRLYEAAERYLVPPSRPSAHELASRLATSRVFEVEDGEPGPLMDV
jgi:hypothetical protein